MNLEIIRTQTTWNDAAGSINSNYAKIADAIAQLKTNGGGGGGGADIDLTDYATKVWVEAKGYITASTLTPYLKTEDAEDTYATKDFVNNKLVNYAPLTSIQGFENRIGGLEGAVPQLNERVTTVEGKVSTLNETVSTGKNNLLDRVNVIEEEYATKTYVDNAIDGIDLSAYLLKADLTKSRIQSTLGISDWALASVKPTYTASEVGALGVNGTAQSALKMTPEYLTDLNNATPWRFFDMKTGYGSADGNKPNIAWVSGITGTAAGSSNYRWQLAMATGSQNPYFRQESNGNWNNWSTLAFTSDIPTKLSQLTDDVVAGKYLPLSGGTLSNALWRSQLTIERSGSANDSVIAFKNSNGLLGCLGYRGADGIPCVWLGETGTGTPIIHANNIGSYNAGSATKLQTPRTIWGQSFDGTKNITHGFRSLYADSYNGGVAHSILNCQFTPYGLLTRIFGNGSVSLQAQREADNAECFNLLLNHLGGNVGIGNTSPTERLDVSGNIKASGNINATSITINGVTITASNGSITVNGNVLATGSITAKKSA